MMDDESNTPEESGDWLSETKNWIQDNIRIVLSIIIVAAIGLGVYAYSQRPAQDSSQIAQEENEEISLEDLLGEDTPGEEEQIQDQEQTPEDQAGEEGIAQQEQQQEQPQAQPSQPEQPQQPEQQSAPQSETEVSQTGDNYQVTAAAGDSLTTLGRAALQQYLQTHDGASLTKEHKIYIEDYLAHQKGYSHYLGVGETKSFSESEISQAVEASTRLSQAQLDHLKVFSQRVSNL